MNNPPPGGGSRETAGTASPPPGWWGNKEDRCVIDEREMIDGYVVHPAASVFPLMEGEEFENLVESVRARGIIHPVVVRRATGFDECDELLDGRNRLRAAEEARNRGVRVDVPVVEWIDDGRNIASWIWDTNAVRRQMTDDGFAIASAAIWPLIAKENEARQEAARFKKGQSGNPSGKKQVEIKSSPPAKRDAKAKDAASTVGQVAAKAGTSMHKARQAIAVQKAIEAGELPAEAAKEVMAGKKKLRDVAPKKNKPASDEPRKRTMKAILEDLRDLIAEWMDAEHNVEVLRDELKTHFERIGQ